MKMNFKPRIARPPLAYIVEVATASAGVGRIEGRKKLEYKQ